MRGKHVIFLVGVLLFSVSCSGSGIGSSLSGFIDSIVNITRDISSLSARDIASLMRFIVAFTIFAISHVVLGRRFGDFRMLGTVIGIVLGITTFVFLPETLLLAAATGYSALIAWLLVLAPMVFILWLWVWFGRFGRIAWLPRLILLAAGLFIYFKFLMVLIRAGVF